MPFSVELSECYIHEEFKNIVVKESEASNKYDKLFDFFNYLRVDANNIDFVNCYSIMADRKSVGFSYKNGQQSKKSLSKKKR